MAWPTGVLAKNRIDLSGKKFGRLIITGEWVRKGKILWWKCICDCGSETIVRGEHLRSGATKSCGCLAKEVSGARVRTHGMSGSKTYNTWSHMLSRCNDPKNKNYGRYGGRGIKVCESWIRFENFLSDMGEKPSNSEIDRVNNEGNYEPNNCKWSNRKEQTRNTCNSRFFDYQGNLKTIVEWAEIINIGYATLYYRLISAKWPIDRAMETKASKHNAGRRKICQSIEDLATGLGIKTLLG